MTVMRVKEVAGLVGGSAILVAIVLGFAHPVFHDVAGGSGDSSTSGTYSSPVVPAMTIDPTNLKMGATVTATKPAETMATSFAAPTFKATAAPGCVNNGQCP
ncbi:MAG: hypothetical protein QOK02_5594 [Mycobacterium sp.]|nr:hypothetical protein [Mycobacterium sp.]